MITAELRVNGQFIGHIYAVNHSNEPYGECEYRYECYLVDTAFENYVVAGKVKHLRTAGAVALFGKICKDIEDQGGR